MNIMYQGIKGSFSSQALHVLCRKYNIQHISIENSQFFKELFESINESTLALIPVENSIAGNVNQNNELFINYNIEAIAEVELKIHHCLYVSEENFTKFGDQISKYKTFKILSHPQALLQCSNFISSNNFEVQEFNDTAGSLKYISENSHDLNLAIAPEFAKKFYKSHILKKNIENMSGNTTRFLLVKQKGIHYSFENSLPNKNKSTFLIELKDIVGSLHNITQILFENNINIKRIISKPHPSKHYTYIFLFDIETNLINNSQIMKQLEENSTFFKLLGSYPEWKS